MIHYVRRRKICLINELRNVECHWKCVTSSTTADIIAIQTNKQTTFLSLPSLMLMNMAQIQSNIPNKCQTLFFGTSNTLPLSLLSILGCFIPNISK